MFIQVTSFANERLVVSYSTEAVSGLWPLRQVICIERAFCCIVSYDSNGQCERCERDMTVFVIEPLLLSV